MDVAYCDCEPNIMDDYLDGKAMTGDETKHTDQDKSKCACDSCHPVASNTGKLDKWDVMAASNALNKRSAELLWKENKELKKQIVTLEHEVERQNTIIAEFASYDASPEAALLAKIASLESSLEGIKERNSELEVELKIQDKANDILEARNAELESSEKKWIKHALDIEARLRMELKTAEDRLAEVYCDRCNARVYP